MQSYDAIIVGGGIFGWSAAYHLQQLGCINVLVVDASAPGIATTGAGAGFVGAWAAGFGPAGWGRNELALEEYSIEFYRALGKRADIQLRENGNLFLARTKAGYDAYIAPMLRHALTPADIQSLDAGAIAELSEGAIAATEVYGATYHPRGIQIHTTPAVQAIADAVLAAGGTAVYGEHVESLQMDGARVTGVVTRNGHTYMSRTVLLACGAWSNDILATIGMTLPIFRVVATRVIGNASGVPATLPTIMIPEQGAWIREHKGGLLWGTGDGYKAVQELPFDLPIGTRPYYPELVTSLTDAVQESFQRLFPMADLTVREWTQGVPVYTVDRTFIAGPVPQVQGLYALTGDNEAGVTHGPALGRLVAEQMLGRPVNDVDAAVFAPGRFTTTYADEAAVARAMPPRR
jgi:glycine/D-amino acid oxidase-like deaminating enzyme